MQVAKLYILLKAILYNKINGNYNQVLSKIININ